MIQAISPPLLDSVERTASFLYSEFEVGPVRLVCFTPSCHVGDCLPHHTPLCHAIRPLAGYRIHARLE